MQGTGTVPIARALFLPRQQDRRRRGGVVVGRRAAINRSRDYRLRCPAWAHPRFCVTTLGKLFTPMCCGSTLSLRYYSHSLNRARLPLTTRYAWVQHNKGGYSTFRDRNWHKTQSMLLSRFWWVTAAWSVQNIVCIPYFIQGTSLTFSAV